MSTADQSLLAAQQAPAKAIERAPEVRITFGSHSPYFYLEAALLKLDESQLSPEQRVAVRSGHARAALKESRASAHTTRDTATLAATV